MHPTGHPLAENNFKRIFLRRFSKLTCFSTLFLIFAGGMVTSTGSGLSVPDWPLSYGMIFPPMVGGVFYEHGHRMVASVVGFFTLCLAISLARLEDRRWIKVLGFCALGAVIFQGILGGITVLFFLPTPVSVGHAVLAQSFFVLTIIIAYSQSVERAQKSHVVSGVPVAPQFGRWLLALTLCIYCQLIVGALMRHTGSGLAIPDFPTMGGYWLPPFNETMLAKINQARVDLNWRFDLRLEPVHIYQVVVHYLHRLLALTILIIVAIIDVVNFRQGNAAQKYKGTLLLLNIILFIQISLGILTVLSLKSPVITSLHVVTGAAMLGTSVLFLLRVSPLQWQGFKKAVLS